MSNLALKVLIVEDETPAAEKLERYLQRYSEGIEVKGKAESIEEAVNWLEANQSTIDLIFMDIQLKDGVSFDIFKEVKVQKPVIFITAYNEFALEAFKMNGIEYLLKPITFTDLSNSLKKVETLGNQLRWSEERNESLVNTFDSSQHKTYKNRFMVNLAIKVTDIYGNIGTCSFIFNAVEFIPSDNTLACNNEINLSLGSDCTATISPDMILEVVLIAVTKIIVLLLQT